MKAKFSMFMRNQAIIQGVQKQKHNMRRSVKQPQNKNMFVKIITTPYRVLIKARDFYVNSMTNCAGRVSYGGATPGALPRSFSAASSARSNDNGDEDFRELLRAASARTLGHDKRVELEILLQQHAAAAKGKNMGSNQGVMRSVSVGMGRIDEDNPCDDFVEEDVINGGGTAKMGVVKKSHLLYPRSKSYAVTNKTLVI